jgi:hypothetical protein
MRVCRSFFRFRFGLEMIKVPVPTRRACHRLGLLSWGAMVLTSFSRYVALREAIELQLPNSLSVRNLMLGWIG